MTWETGSLQTARTANPELCYRAKQTTTKGRAANILQACLRVGSRLSNDFLDRTRSYDEVDRISGVGDAVRAALACGKPAVVDLAVDPAALYSFRRDSFKHRGG